MRVPPCASGRRTFPLLVRHFVERLTPELGKEIAEMSEGALRLLLDHEWPGNVRELENAVERAIVTCRTRILTEDDFSFLNASDRAKGSWIIPPNTSLSDLEKEAIRVTLERVGGNIKEAAAILGIDRSTLYEKVKRYEIPR